MKRYFFIFVALLMILFPFSSESQIPRTLSYQGLLTDTLGNLKPNGIYAFTIRLYETSTGGSPIWIELKNLSVSRGLFSTILGDQTPFDPSIRFDRQYWLGIQLGMEPELSPRIPLTAVGYSMNSMKADTARYAIAGTIPNNSVSTEKIQDGAVTGAKIATTLVLNAPPSGGTSSTLEATNNSISFLPYVIRAISTNTASGVLAQSVLGNGLRASSTNGFGVHANNATGPGVFTAAIRGDNSGGGYAGAFNGNVRVVGTVTKSAGSFKIDHPVDPANKYLSHSFVESPDMMNIYNGNVGLDGKGEAWVHLPAWFEALNRDYRYQLTAIGAPAPDLYIAEEVSGTRFKIAGGKPWMKVSWQVTGIRQDPYANSHRIPVEEEKPANERGRYQHPELYGMPREMAVDYVAEPPSESIAKDTSQPRRIRGQRSER